MKQIVHYSIKLDTFGGRTDDGTKCVGLVITDEERNCMDCYPIPLDVAEDLGNELIRLAIRTRSI